MNKLIGAGIGAAVGFYGSGMLGMAGVLPNLGRPDDALYVYAAAGAALGYYLA